MFLVAWLARFVKHLAEFSHELTTRPSRPHIPSKDTGSRERLTVFVDLASERGLSSAGRAPDLHSGGHRFDPDRLHQMGR
jgi:hypothetical protein